METSKINTHSEWNSLQLDQSSMAELKKMLGWLESAKTPAHKAVQDKKANAGYRAVFYGPAAAVKQSVTGFLGKLVGAEVYTVDVSKLVSKYTGETEKNLETILAKAKENNAILFFDEADALFGHRSFSGEKETASPAGRLLKKMDTFTGCCILALTTKPADDTLIAHRVESVIYFPGQDKGDG